jgi:aryl-alcohol dehydrogenase-like predicted oxidoreductase
MGLPLRTLGQDGPAITTIGVGTWAIGGGGWDFGWGPQDDERSLAALRRAVEAGINWIDTAAVYGHGHSEEVVGRLLRDFPEADRPLVFTKCGLQWDPQAPLAGERRVLAPASIRRECEDSLRRLGVERIDLYQFHWPDETGVPVEESWAEMQRLVDEGKVRWAGVSNFHADLLDRCAAIRHVDSLQNHFSLVTRDAGAEDLNWCRAHGTGFLCYSPMESGQLTDSFSLERLRALPDDDWRKRAEGFQEAAVRRNLALRDALRPIALRHGTTVASVAVAWVLAWPGVTAAIVGARSPEQVDGWLSAAGLELTGADLAEIAAAVASTGAGSGPARPPAS